MHWFNVTCTGHYSPSGIELCNFSEAQPLGCQVECKSECNMDVTLVYNVSTSEEKVEWCRVDDYVWVEGDGALSGLLCRNDNGETSCSDNQVNKNGLNNMTLLGLPAPQQYWWNVKCKTRTGGNVDISDIGDVNWTFILKCPAG